MDIQLRKLLYAPRLSKRTTKGRDLDFASVTKALTYPSALLSEIGIFDLRDCSTRSVGPTSLHSIDGN